MNDASQRKKLLLTGATGFVGRAVESALVAAGWAVRSLTRQARRARQPTPGVEWAEGNIASSADVARVLDGVKATLYLVHEMGQGPNFEQREVDEAGRFAEAASRAGVERIVYLGGVAPAGEASPHLHSRLAVGRTLRSGRVPTIELRASMIIGHGSLSWLIVRDLVARLPVMVLPSWLHSRTEPVAIDDVVAALVAAVDLPETASASFDLPGPDVLSGRQILEETARQMHLAPPLAIEVPVLTPRLSSHWVRFVTRADWSVAREVVVGLTHDLLARDDRFWRQIGHMRRLSFGEAASRTLANEGPTPGAWGFVERMLKQQRRQAHA
ncbi:MAG TPA: NAD(P)H-binding protein [Polyangia bacterium]|nr:NAD(P)H-binding protein [Polyangia bacterium]